MYQTTIRVIFRDVDALGHVNNAVYFTYMESARVQFFIRQMELADLGELPIIVAEATCTYLSPAYFDEELKVSVSVPRIGRKSFDLQYDIVATDRRPVAGGKTVQVAYDYATRRSIPIPDRLMRVLEANRTAEASPRED